MWMGEWKEEGRRRRDPREQRESLAEWERLLPGLTELWRVSVRSPEPQPSEEEVESVFRRVMSSY
jgi:hypothetical protein